MSEKEYIDKWVKKNVDVRSLNYWQDVSGVLEEFLRDYERDIVLGQWEDL